MEFIPEAAGTYSSLRAKGFLEVNSSQLGKHCCIQQLKLAFIAYLIKAEGYLRISILSDLQSGMSANKQSKLMRRCLTADYCLSMLSLPLGRSTEDMPMEYKFSYFIPT